MAMPVIQPSFAAGELAPGLYARVDLAKFHVGAALMRNFFTDARGGASNRTGTQFIVQCLAGTNRLIEFSFSTTQTYALLFSDLKLRFVTNGGVLLEGTKAITGATQANPCAITCIGHGYATGDWVWVISVGGMSRLNSRFFLITKIDNDHFTLQDPATGANIDATAFAAYTAGGTAARVYTIVSPYAAADLALLKFTQSADVMTFTHPNYQPRKLVRSGATNWAFSALAAAATQAPPTGVVVTPAVGAAGTTYRYVVVAVTAQGVRSVPSVAGATAVAATMSTTAPENMTVAYAAPAGPAPAYYEVFRQIEVPAGAPDANELFGYVGASMGTSFVDRNIAPDFTRTPQIAFDPFAAGAWPYCTAYYQNRQTFAGATVQPLGVNFSKTGDYLNFNYSSPARDDDGISATITSRQVNNIKHLVPMQSLIALTGSGAWRLDGGAQSGPITPGNLQAVPQAYNGCSDVPPIVINYDILYVQSKGSIVRDLAYNFYVNIYTGADMTVLSNHLFFGHQILEWAWAEEPFKVVWAVREDGMLLSFTYLKEQDIYAWGHHDSDGLFKSVCSISEGNENVVYTVVQRLVNGSLVQYVERMASRNMNTKPDYTPSVPADLTKAWFVDCGLRYPLTYPNATLTPTGTGRAPSTVPRLPFIVYSIVGAAAIAGGANYSANPTVIVTDVFGTGAGAQITANVVAGVITGFNIVASGANYQQPVITIQDRTGAGAVASAILSNDVVMNSSVAHGAKVGDMVRVNDGWGPVRLVNSATQITVNVQQPLSNVWPSAANSWSCTTPITNIAGLDHLEGKTVSILADGLVVTDGQTNTITVHNGALQLPQAASSIVIGLPYKSQLKSLYIDVAGQPQTAQGRRIQVPAVTVRVQDSVGVKIGHTFELEDLIEVKVDPEFQPLGYPLLPYTGDKRVVIGSTWEVDAQVCVEQSNPLPATILAFIPDVNVGDTPSP